MVSRSPMSDLSESLLDRNVVDVVFEVARSSKLDALRSAPFAVAWDRHHADPEAIAQLLSGDRIAALGVENRDQVRNGDDDLVVFDDDQVLVLETDRHLAAG